MSYSHPDLMTPTPAPESRTPDYHLATPEVPEAKEPPIMRKRPPAARREFAVWMRNQLGFDTIDAP